MSICVYACLASSLQSRGGAIAVDQALCLQWPPPHWYPQCGDHNATMQCYRQWAPLQCNGHLHTDPHSGDHNALGTSSPAQCYRQVHSAMGTSALHNVIDSCTMQWCSAVQCSMGRFAAAPPPVKMPLPHQCCATAKPFIPVHLWDWSTHTCHPRSRFLSFLNALIYLSVICSTMWVLWFNSGIYSTMWDMGTRILLCHLLHHVGNLIQDLCKDQRHDVHDILVMGL